jgi:hypothetical protein
MAAIDALKLGVECYIGELDTNELQQLLAAVRPDLALQVQGVLRHE